MFSSIILSCLLLSPVCASDAIDKTATTIFSPTMFGANGNDERDDSGAFQMCVEAAKKQRVAMISVPPGRYILKDEITIDGVSNLILEGNGAILEKPNGSKSNIFCGYYNQQITIRNFVFEGNHSDNFVGEWPKKMNACAILGRSSGIRFENCTVRNFYYGVCLGTSTENGYDVWVTNCQFENNNSDIDLYGKPLVFIKGNVSHNCTSHSIQIEPPYKRETETFNYLEQSKIDALSVGNIISENVIVGCKGIGIILFGGSEDITISGNQIINYGTAGILAHPGSANVQICNNIISHTLYDKKNERPWKDQGAGIIITRVNNAMIYGNLISHANTGLYLSGSEDAMISNNRISDSKDAGICLYGSKTSMLSANYVENYNLDKSWWANSGIVIYESENIMVTGTTITDCGNSDYSVYVGKSKAINLDNVVGKGYKKALSNIKTNRN